MLDKIRRYLSIADQVFQIAASDVSAETKYAQIFSEDGSRALEHIFQLDYYDPDTSYEEDVNAYVVALRAKCAELRKIVTCVVTPRPAESPSQHYSASARQGRYE